MQQFWKYLAPVIPLALVAAVCAMSFGGSEEKPKEFKVYPIGYVKKADGKTLIVLDKKYESGLQRMEKLSEIWVLWWFDRNDTPEKRSILQVHPQGNPDNPLTGVFATHSPRRPNLIAMTGCKVLSVKENVIEIADSDIHWLEPRDVLLSELSMKIND